MRDVRIRNLGQFFGEGQDEFPAPAFVIEPGLTPESANHRLGIPPYSRYHPPLFWAAGGEGSRSIWPFVAGQFCRSTFRREA